MAKNEFGITEDAAHREVKMQVEEAVNFIFSEFEGDWEKAEKYYAGGSDLPVDEGRSHVVKTVVRDSIRAVRPSVMRTLLTSRKIVEYIPNNVSVAAWAEQQSEYATQLFWKSGGYRQLLAAFDTAAKLKIGPMQVVWVEKPTAQWFERNNVDRETLDQFYNDDSVELEDVTIVDKDDPELADMYNITGYQYFPSGRIEIEAVPNYEFFITRNANSVADACQRYVHGRRRIVTVEEAIEMDLDYDNWLELDAEDPEQSEHTNSSYFRRKYQKNDYHDMGNQDLMQHQFMLTAAYKRFDFEGTGVPRLYCFWLGGTSYKLIDVEPVEDSPFEVMQIDPIPFTVLANSIADLTIEEQDMSTSILRAIADNFHMSNNPRSAADPRRTNFDDLSSKKIGAPIRNKGDAPIQTVSIPFTGQAGLPLMDYLDRDIEEKIGYTKAATGLDPDAMQSTDKQAVMNTIQLSQGQIELIVRNICETCLVPLFRKMLKLQVAYGADTDIIRSKGELIQLPMAIIDPDLVAEPKVGLGTGNVQEKTQALQFVLQKQEALMAQYGPNNPFTSLVQIYNTIEDLLEAYSITNVGRYFNVITPEVEQMLAQEQAKAQQEAMENQPPAPQEVVMQIEGKKAQLKEQELMLEHREAQINSQLKALESAEKLDIERDKLIQDRVISLAEVQQGDAELRIKKEQADNNKDRIDAVPSGN